MANGRYPFYTCSERKSFAGFLTGKDRSTISRVRGACQTQGPCTTVQLVYCTRAPHLRGAIPMALYVKYMPFTYNVNEVRAHLPHEVGGTVSAESWSSEGESPL